MLLDTDLCIGVLRKRPRAIAWLLRHAPDQVMISTITLFELNRGVAGAHDPAAERHRVNAFLSPIHVVPFDPEAAIRSAEVVSTLERRGQVIGPYDSLLAGHALALGVALVTGNMKEFSRIPGLQLEDWQHG